MHFALAVILTNAHLVTMAETARDKDATVLAVRDGKIAYIGPSFTEAKKVVGADASVIDVKGHTVVPGFNDAHVHFGLSLTLGSGRGVDIPNASKKVWLKAVERESTARPDKGWLFVKTPLLPDGISNSKHLDGFRRPLFVVTARGGLLNHAGMVAAGLTEDEAPEGFVRGRELAAALDQIAKRLPEKTLYEGALFFLQLLAQNGITSVQLFDEFPDLFERLRTEGKLSARIRFIPVGFRFDTHSYQSDWKATDPSWVRVDGIKFFHDAGARLTRWEMETIHRQYVPQKTPILIHVISQHALGTFLESLRKLLRGDESAAKLYRLEHVDDVSIEQARELARLHITACPNPSMLPEWGTARAFPLRTLLAAKVRTCVGSDWVGRHIPERSLSPISGMASAVGRAGLGSAEQISAADALALFTRENARAENQLAEKGTLEVGKFADLAVLSADPLAVPIDELGQIEVLITMSGGRVVHRQGIFSKPPPERTPDTIGPPGNQGPTLLPPKKTK